MWINLIEMIIGFSSGLAVGAGFVALITLLKILPRLIQLTKTVYFIHVFISSIIAGAIFAGYLSFAPIVWHYSIFGSMIWGGFHGIFNGMLIAALAEVLNVFPIFLRRLNLKVWLKWFVMAFVFGKMAGSLFQWLFFD
ncbi:MAG TPA: stage V sporulation protein AB [Cerasibacillus sp.]|uniref:stage V sporulation protein AB n=1 Tax=Cerasibacillus sp. TaxID=2498711 RepID=UPI002F41D733